ncbi:TVP38/TMEM64 family protein [Candidatus Pacearchaeota archaeon]|nr:TVP38/TMEM64 family protein [Candidatus Pacearchaeota archaeon]
MPYITKSKLNAAISIALIIILFLFVSYLVQTNIDYIRNNLDYGINGMIFYIIALVISIVFAPVSVVPLIPIASGLWGWQITGLLNIIGWSLGAVIAFLISRKYGVPLVSKLLPIKKLYDFEKYLPEKHLFFVVVFFRMVTPVDGLSYVLGLFTRMSFVSFTLATVIGITPFSFIFAYAGTLNLWYQILFLTIAFLVFLLGVLIAYLNYKRKEKSRKSR